jgi:hypothetical protein
MGPDERKALNSEKSKLLHLLNGGPDLNVDFGF